MTARRYEIRGATVAHAEYLCDHAREADRVELLASGGVTPHEAMLQGILDSDLCWTGMADGEPLNMFGVVPVSILGGVGVPWMIGSEGLEHHQFALARLSRPCLAVMRKRYNVLTNYVDARNDAAHRWLRWMGFDLGEPVRYGRNGELFLPFLWKRD